MARKSQPQKPVESQPETGESESDSVESEQNETQVKNASSKSAPKLKSQTQSSSKMADEEESDSGSESESESDQNLNLVASKPKKGSKEHSTPVKSSGSKRPAEASKETTTGKDKKRSKKKVDVQNQPSSSEAPKRGLFERKWSKEEEIVILDKMLDCSVKKNLDPAANVEIFFDIIKNNLHVDATCVKLKEKIRKLKTKYLGHLSQELEGKLRNFSDAHQEISYKLSKKIWGDKIDNVVAVRNNKKSKINSVNDDVSRDCKEVKSVNPDSNLLVSKAVCSGSVEEMILRIGDEFFQGTESELEYKKIRNEEIELYLKKLDLMREKTRLVLDVLKSTD